MLRRPPSVWDGLAGCLVYKGTIKENLRFGNLHASDEEIIEATKVANVDHFIRTLSGGYNMEMN